MNKIALTLFFAFSASAGAFLLSGCKNNFNKPAPATATGVLSANATQAEKKAHLEYVLSRVVLIRMNGEGTLELSGEIVTDKEFCKKIRAQGKATPGKPVLFYYNPSDTRENTRTIGLVIRECKAAKLGKIYRDVPDRL